MKGCLKVVKLLIERFPLDKLDEERAKKDMEIMAHISECKECQKFFLEFKGGTLSEEPLKKEGDLLSLILGKENFLVSLNTFILFQLKNIIKADIYGVLSIINNKTKVFIISRQGLGQAGKYRFLNIFIKGARALGLYLKPEEIKVELLFIGENLDSHKESEKRSYSYLCQPIMIKGKHAGLIVVCNFSRKKFDETDTKVMSILSEQVAITLEKRYLPNNEILEPTNSNLCPRHTFLIEN